jgi:hypothetical protein
VEHVVPDLHVVEDLGHGQADGPEQPRAGEAARDEQGPAAELDLAVDVDDPPDVRRVTLAEAAEHALAEGVELDPEPLDVVGGQVRDLAVDLSFQGCHVGSIVRCPGEVSCMRRVRRLPACGW